MSIDWIIDEDFQHLEFVLMFGEPDRRFLIEGLLIRYSSILQSKQ